MKKKLLTILMIVCMAAVFMPALSWATGNTDGTDGADQTTNVENTTSSDEEESDGVLETADGETYTITTSVVNSAGETAGTLTADKTSATAGETVTLTLTVNPGYLSAPNWNYPSSISSSWTHENGVITFTMPSENVTITATAVEADFELVSGETKTYYENLSYAVTAAATSGDTIKLLKNQETDQNQTKCIKPIDLQTKNITLDFNGHEITYKSEDTNYHLMAFNGTLNIVDGKLYSRDSATDQGKTSITAGYNSVINIYSGQFGGAFVENKKYDYADSATKYGEDYNAGDINLYGGYYNNIANTNNYTAEGYIASEIPAGDSYYPTSTFFKDYSVYCVWNPEHAEATITWKNTETGATEDEYYYEIERAVQVAQQTWPGYEFVQINLLKDATVEAAMTISTSIKMVMNDGADITSTSTGVFVVSNSATFTLEGNNKNIISSTNGNQVNNVIIVNNGSTLTASNIKLLYNNDTNYNSKIKLINNLGTSIIKKCSLVVNAAQADAIYSEGIINVDETDFVMSSDDTAPTIAGIEDAASNTDIISNITIAINTTKDTRGNLYGITTSGGISIDESVVIKMNNNGATAYGIDFKGLGATVTKAYISVISGNSTSACVNASQPIVIYGGYYSNKNSSGENSAAVAFSGESTNINAIGGVYTQEVNSNYVHDTSASDPNKDKYQCVSLNPTVTYDNVVYTHTIVPKEVCKLTTASNTTGTTYHTLQAAIDAITASDTNCKITLLKNIDSLSGLNSGYSNAQFNFVKDKKSTAFATKFPVTLDMAGYSITIPKIDYPLFIENCNLTIVNSSSSNSTISNGDGDAIHVGAEKTAADYSKLTVDNTSNNIFISASSSDANAIKTGWEYKDDSGTTHTCIGTTIINGGCYSGDITKGSTGSEYTITGGYYTDKELYTGKLADTGVTPGSKASYIASGYACISTPTDDSHYNDYKYMVVSDDISIKPKFSATSYTLKDLITFYVYFNDFTDAPTHTVADGGHYMAITVRDADNNKTRTEKVLITESQKRSDGRYVISLDGFIPKHYANTIKLQITDAGGHVIVSASTSIAKYCASKVSKTSTEQNLKDVCKTIANYGAYTQLYFGYNTSSLANANLPDADKTFAFSEIETDMESGKYKDQKKIIKYDAEGNESETYMAGVEAVGQSLILGDTTPIRYYFNLTGGTYRARYTKGSEFDEDNCNDLTLQSCNISKDSKTANYFVEVSGIKYTGYAIPYTVRIDKQNEDGTYTKYVDVSYSVDSYTYEKINELKSKSSLTDDETNELNLMKSMYLLKKYSRIHAGLDVTKE